MEFPIFSGEEPKDWIVKAKKSFEFYQMTEMEKIKAIVVGLKGDALAWFRWENKRKAITSWRSLKKMMLKHFPGRKRGSMMEKWLTVRQDEMWRSKRSVSFTYPRTWKKMLVKNFCSLISSGAGDFNTGELRLIEPATMEEALDWG